MKSTLLLLSSVALVLASTAAVLPTSTALAKEAQMLDQEPQTGASEPANWTNLLFEATTKPRLFKGSDGCYHLTYELIVTNYTGKEVFIDLIEVVDYQDRKAGKPVYAMSGENLLKWTRAANPMAGSYPIKAGEFRIIFVNVSFASEKDAPPLVAHHIKYHTRDHIKMEIKDFQETLLPFAIKQKEPVEISPPLRGTGWLAVGGYASMIGHRRSLMPIDNKLRLAGRFAIDWIQIDKDGFSKKGDRAKLESSVCYGAPVYAVESGEVIAAVTNFEDQPVGKATDDKYKPSGNYVTIKHPGGFYSLYAHLKPGSIKVKVGDRIKRGQLLAQVGNSGNTDGPHLHLNITDAPGPLSADGIPYVFGQFKKVGRIEDINLAIKKDESASKQDVIEIAPVTCNDELVREGDIVDFGDK